MPVETDNQTKCIEYATELGIVALKMECKSRRGFPDVMLVFPNGHIAFCELKTFKRTGRLDVLQKQTIKLLRGNHADVFTADTLEKFKQAIADRLDARASRDC